MYYIQLSTAEHRNKKVKQTILSNFPCNHNVTVLFPKVIYIVRKGDIKFRQDLLMNIKNKESLIRDYLLSASKIQHYVEEEINLQVTDVKLNDARIRHSLIRSTKAF